MLIASLEFAHVATIHPEHRPDGQIAEFMPQSRYVNRRALPLNPHGTGPFCRFSVKGLPTEQGVYALTVDGQRAYIGECENLSLRFGPRGYGTIAPRNCYVGGQSTNCKVNHSVLLEAKRRARIDLWFYRCTSRKSIEAQLLDKLRPPWNSSRV